MSPRVDEAACLPPGGTRLHIHLGGRGRMSPSVMGMRPPCPPPVEGTGMSTLWRDEVGTAHPSGARGWHVHLVGVMSPALPISWREEPACSPLGEMRLACAPPRSRPALPNLLGARGQCVSLQSQGRHCPPPEGAAMRPTCPPRQRRGWHVPLRGVRPVCPPLGQGHLRGGSKAATGHCWTCGRCVCSPVGMVRSPWLWPWVER